MTQPLNYYQQMQAPIWAEQNYRAYFSLYITLYIRTISAAIIYKKLFLYIMPTGAFNICCPRDCVSRHNGGTSGAPLKPLRVDSALRALSILRGLRGAPEVTPLCRETQSLVQQMLELSCENATVGKNGLMSKLLY